MRYKSKPVTIEAIQWTGDNYGEVYDFADGGFNAGLNESGHRSKGVWAEVYDYLQETWVGVNLNDYIIMGTKGEFYPCDPEVFAAKYEPDDELGFKEPEFTK